MSSLSLIRIINTGGQHQPSLQIQARGQHNTEQLLTERIWPNTRWQHQSSTQTYTRG